MKINLYILSLLLLAGMSSCFEEYDEGYDLIGRVATIPVYTLSQTSAAEGTEITVNFRYYSEHEPVTQLRLVQIIGDQSTVVNTKDISGHNLEDSYEDSFSYTVPAGTGGSVITLRLEVVTANDLVNSSQANLTVPVAED